MLTTTVKILHLPPMSSIDWGRDGGAGHQAAYRGYRRWGLGWKPGECPIHSGQQAWKLLRATRAFTGNFVWDVHKGGVMLRRKNSRRSTMLPSLFWSTVVANEFSLVLTMVVREVKHGVIALIFKVFSPFSWIEVSLHLSNQLLGSSGRSDLDLVW